MLNIETLLTEEGAAEAGFSWESGEVSYDPNKNRQLVSLGEAPHVRVVDVAKFEANFPGVILAALNGTSIKVACQAVTRRMLVAVKAGAAKPSLRDLMVAVLNALRGVKNRAVTIERQVFVSTLTKQTYATMEEAQAADIAALIDLGVDPAAARERVLQA